MRRNKGLLITMIIIIVVLILAVVGLVLWKFVFSNNNTDNTQNPAANTPTEQQRYEIAVGDYVDYVPDSKLNYLLTESTSGSDKNSSEGIEQEEIKWRILSINDDGTVDIISEEPISEEVYFGGAIGVNNAVYLLNDLCKKQYSNEELETTARSLSLIDLENNMSETGIQARNVYALNDVSYGDRQIYAEDNAYVPAIYSELGLDVASESLAHYEEPTEGTFVRTETVQLLQTFYKIEDITADYFENEEYYNLIFNTINGSWLATRCIDCSSEQAKYGLFTIGDNTISGSAICTSGGRTGESQNFIRPIVTLGEDIEISEFETGAVDDPRALTKLDLSDDDNEDEEDSDFESDGMSVEDNANMIAMLTFNANFTSYEGEGQSAAQVRSIISAVKSSNAKSEHQIEVKGVTTELRANRKYTVTLEYDEVGYISIINIEEEEEEETESSDNIIEEQISNLTLIQ